MTFSQVTVEFPNKFVYGFCPGYGVPVLTDTFLLPHLNPPIEKLFVYVTTLILAVSYSTHIHVPAEHILKKFCLSVCA